MKQSKNKSKKSQIYFLTLKKRQKIKAKWLFQMQEIKKAQLIKKM